MAITRVQQSQISGSLSYDDSLSAGSGLAGKSTLAGDLNALRSQLNKVIGKSNWFDAIDGSQDLADIYAAVHMTGADAAFQGSISAVGNVSAGGGTFTGSLGVTGATTLSSTLTVVDAATLSGSLEVLGSSTMQNGLTVNGAVADFNAGVTASKITLDGAGAPGQLYIVAGDSSIVDTSSLVFDGTKLSVTGNLEVTGSSAITGDLTVAGLATFSGGAVVNNIAGLEITGSFGVLGDSVLNGSLTTTGVASFASAVTGSAGMDLTGGLAVDSVKIDGDIAYRLYVVGTDGSITDSPSMQFTAGGELAVTGSFAAIDSMGARNFTVDAASGDVAMAGDLTVSGNDIKSSSATALSLSGSDVEVVGDLKVTGNDIKASDSATAISLLGGGDVEVKGDLKVTGNDVKASDGNVAISLLGSGDVQIARHLDVVGDLRVKGSMTYIDTANMRVEDAFIYLATGSAGTTDSGIVLHGGAGAGMDLVIGQDGGAGEVIFGKMDRSPDGDGAMNGIALVAAWSSAIKLGSAEGSLSGSLAAVDGGIELKAAASKSLSVEAGSDLTFKANGFSMDLGSSSEYSTFDTNFSATTIVGALNELYSAGAGGSKKGNLSVANVTAGVLDFSSIGTLGAASQQFVDVYLNGVLLAYGRDLSGLTTTSIAIDGSISLIADDCLTVVLRGAA